MAMTKQAQEAATEERSLQLLLDFCEEAFERAGNGDLAEAARVAARRATLNGLVSGPLWDEVGDQLTSDLMRTRRFHVVRRWSAGRGRDADQTTSAADPDDRLMAMPFSVEGRWIGLGDLKRRELLLLAQDRLTRAATMTVDARFFERLAEGLKGEEKVTDRYSQDELRRIRKEIEDGKPI